MSILSLSRRQQFSSLFFFLETLLISSKHHRLYLQGILNLHSNSGSSVSSSSEGLCSESTLQTSPQVSLNRLCLVLSVHGSVSRSSILRLNSSPLQNLGMACYFTQFSMLYTVLCSFCLYHILYTFHILLHKSAINSLSYFYFHYFVLIFTFMESLQ